MYFVCMNFDLNICLCATCTQYLRRTEKGVGSLELQTVVSSHMGAGN